MTNGYNISTHDCVNDTVQVCLFRIVNVSLACFIIIKVNDYFSRITWFRGQFIFPPAGIGDSIDWSDWYDYLCLGYLQYHYRNAPPIRITGNSFRNPYIPCHNVIPTGLWKSNQMAMATCPTHYNFPRICLFWTSWWRTLERVWSLWWEVSASSTNGYGV